MKKQITITTAKLVEECECLGVFIQILVKKFAATLDMKTSWIVAVELALADYGLKIVDAVTGKDLDQESDDVHVQTP